MQIQSNFIYLDFLYICLFDEFSSNDSSAEAIGILEKGLFFNLINAS
jgi:hypothetical protein